MKLWLCNAIVGAACLVIGIAGLVRGDLVFGILDVLLGIINGAVAVWGYHKK